MNLFIRVDVGCCFGKPVFLFKLKHAIPFLAELFYSVLKPDAAVKLDPYLTSAVVREAQNAISAVLYEKMNFQHSLVADILNQYHFEVMPTEMLSFTFSHT